MSGGRTIAGSQATASRADGCGGLLFVLYVGSTGKPKGIIHTTGWLMQTYLTTSTSLIHRGKRLW
jgi:acyl-coenzyme A synthetase/AMP-(fatty) acid ligase